MKKETYLYSSTWDRLRNEYKIFLLAFLFIIIADSIGQIQIPVGPGTLILFPIFYALLLGVLSGPEALKIFKTHQRSEGGIQAGHRRHLSLHCKTGHQCRRHH